MFPYKNTIDILNSIGYTTINKEEVTPLIDDVLQTQLTSINSFEYKNETYTFSQKNIHHAIKRLDTPLHESILEVNANITEQLLLGNAYEELLEDGSKKSFSLHYIDFTQPQKNIFHYQYNKNIGIILFINGIAFGIITLQKSGITYAQEQMPNLFKFSQILLTQEQGIPRYATLNTPKKFWANWDFSTDFETTLIALFSYERVLTLLSSYIITDNTTKKIARSQQFFAIQTILQHIAHYDKNKKRSSGMLWQTHGSGKILTMIMLTRIIKKNIQNAKIVLVSQNKQLVKQFCSTLAKNSLEVHNAGTKQELIKELYNGKTVLAISTNKLETLRKEKKPFDDKNLFILVDISHHTSKHTLYKNMNQLFASASYLGFSSTPFMQKEKTLLTQFSSILYKYTNAQALKDKIIVPLLYENRAKQLENNYVTRLQTLVSYIEKHFIQNFQGSNFQAILATNTEDQAYECHKLFTNLGSIKTALLLPNYEPSQEDETIELFIGTNLFTLPLHLPRATLLYLDQTLNSHALLETFSSINKLADGKDFGFIIDYRGLLGNLENPLTTYAPLHGFDEKDLLGTVIDIKKEIYQLPIHLHNLELFFGEDNAPKDEESYAIFLEEENKRILFYNYVFMCKKALKLSLASETTAEVFTKETLTLYKEKIQFYTKLKTYIQMRYCEHKEPLYLFSQTFEDTLATMKGINAKADTILYTLRATLAEKLVTNPHYYEKLLCKITDTLQAYNDYIISDQEKLDLAQEIKTTVLSQIEHPCAKAIFDNIAKEFHKTLQERSSLVIENIALSFAKIFQEMSKKPEWHTNQDILNQIDEQIENILWDLEDTYALKFQNMDELITKIRTIGIHNQTGNTTIPSIHHSNLN